MEINDFFFIEYSPKYLYEDADPSQKYYIKSFSITHSSDTPITRIGYYPGSHKLARLNVMAFETGALISKKAGESIALHVDFEDNRDVEKESLRHILPLAVFGRVWKREYNAEENDLIIEILLPCGKDSISNGVYLDDETS